jgi:hypothetical protein
MRSFRLRGVRVEIGITVTGEGWKASENLTDEEMNNEERTMNN